MNLKVDLFKNVIGSENIITEVEGLKRYHCTTIPEKRRIDAVLKPGNKEEICEILKIANQNHIALYPISTGNNWGYGSAIPVKDNNVILDLGRLNRIIEVNTELAYAVIEPGVTQEQLYTYLKEKKTGLIMDPTGSGPSCSVLGNTLERGYGITPYGDHFNAACGMEIVLADGEILRTGFGHFSNSKVTRVFKYGTGPYLDGMFTQSNLGIVISIGVWLMPEPEHFEVCFFGSDEKDALGEFVAATRWLLLNQVVKGSINIMHRNRILTLMMPYPWDEMNQRIPLDDSISRQIAKQRDICEWNGVVALYGTREEVLASKKVIKRVLRGKTKRINFVSEQLLNLVEKYQWIMGPIGRMIGMDIKELIKVLRPSLDLMKGKPGEVSLPTPYWRSKKEMPEANINPARDNCGIIWLAPVVPLTKEDAEDYISIITPILNEYGFEVCITFTAVTARAFDCTLPILYDKADEQETNRAIECHKKALKACMKNGYIPYRFGVQSMDDIVDADDVFWKVAGKIKESLDPNGIFSPKRYSLR
ncbi:FAD-binding oxidoreductase [Desulfobacula sp.]|uniref:FAD-binding oxidoreductase n=1 Tax=Desulfobacula sp. TaxID=2593537 RepID=UPI002606D4F5|nr:FAD-binding oxidoreductase [Desulfobacula sp.]